MMLKEAPETFGIVEEGVYRSENIKSEHLNFIKNLKLKTWLIVSTEGISKNHKVISQFIKDENIQLVHLGSQIGDYNDYFLDNFSWKPLSEELVIDGLQYILNPLNYPLLISCSTGLHETSALIGCLRKLQLWNFNSIVVEYRGYAKSKAKPGIEQFIELFDCDLYNLPDVLPEWFNYHLELLEKEEKEHGA